MLLTREQRKEARLRFQNPYKVGDIMHHSWGYDQTNCDFYQVVGITGSSVDLRKIVSERVPGSEGFMCERRMPLKDEFAFTGCQFLTKNNHEITPEPIRKRVSFWVENDGSLRYCIPTPQGFCDLWTGKSEYNSWYA